MNLLRLCLFIIAAAWVASRQWAPISHEPGVLIPQMPEQMDHKSEEAPIRHGEWILKPLATYVIHARVLGAARYRFDTVAELSPLDLLLGWGPMSDSSVLEKMSFDQRKRFGFWQYARDCVLTEPEIRSHAANVHVIPADDHLHSRLTALKVGSLVRLQGLLVEAVHSERGGKPWRSSLTRTDRGDGACEILYVKSMREL